MFGEHIVTAPTPFDNRALGPLKHGLTGARVYFTPTGRTFLRERFDATPAEFLRMVRV